MLLPHYFLCFSEERFWLLYHFWSPTNQGVCCMCFVRCIILHINCCSKILLFQIVITFLPCFRFKPTWTLSHIGRYWRTRHSCGGTKYGPWWWAFRGHYKSLIACRYHKDEGTQIQLMLNSGIVNYCRHMWGEFCIISTNTTNPTVTPFRKRSMIPRALRGFS